MRTDSGQRNMACMHSSIRWQLGDGAGWEVSIRQPRLHAARMQTEESASLGVSTHGDASARSQLSTALAPIVLVKLQLVLKQRVPAARNKSAAVNNCFLQKQPKR